MKRKFFMGIFLAIFVYSAVVVAQEKMEIKPRTVEWKLGRAAWHMDLYICTGIAYAKAMGKTADEYGKFVGELFAPSWEASKGKGVEPVLQTWSGHMQIYKNGSIEILEQAPDSVTVKYNRPYAGLFEDGGVYGVTMDEYETFMRNMTTAISEYLGLNISQKLEGDYFIVTISEKK